MILVDFTVVIEFVRPILVWLKVLSFNFRFLNYFFGDIYFMVVVVAVALQWSDVGIVGGVGN